jgi:hypothetical protein
MYLVVIGWMYVVLMMSVAEANHPTGTLLGAAVTFVLYGVGPVALVVYLMRTPARRRAIKAREAAETAAARQNSNAPDASGHAAGAAQALPTGTDVAPVREKP